MRWGRLEIRNTECLGEREGVYMGACPGFSVFASAVSGEICVVHFRFLSARER